MSLQIALSRFLLRFAEALAATGVPVAQAHAGRLLEMETGLSARRISATPSRIPVQAACEADLKEEAMESLLAQSLLQLMPALHLTRSQSYSAHPPSPGFAERYGYGVICGPASGPPALLADPTISFGLLMLAPHTHYPLHHHPADELYYVASGRSEWWAGPGPWQDRRPGEAIHHPSWIPHATRTEDQPLTALYVWQGDLVTDAAFLTQRVGTSAEAVDGA